MDVPHWVWATAVVASLCAVSGVLLANLFGGETKIQRRIGRHFGLLRFLNELGVPLGPPFLAHSRLGALLHCKLIIVDRLLVSVGSTNFDNRSFKPGDEATLNVVDAAFAKVQTATFESDLGKSNQVSHAQWLARPYRERFAEVFASVLGPQL